MFHRIIYSTARLYWRLFKPRTLGVRVIVENRKKEILLVQHTYVPHYYFPGGAVSLNESFEEAAIREVKEETGVEIHKLTFQGVYQHFKEGKQDVIVVFSAKSAKERPVVKRQKNEILNAAWYKANDLPQLSSTTSEILNRYQSRGSKKTGVLE